MKNFYAFVLFYSFLVIQICIANGLIDVHSVSIEGNRPGVRSAPQMVLVGNKAVILFGFLECFQASSCDNYFYNDTWVVDLNRRPLQWELKMPSGPSPPPRTFFGADRYNGKVVFFGGVRYNVDLSIFDVYSDIWFYDVAENTYENVVFPAGTGPGQRIGTAIKVYNDAFYVIGGFDATFTGHNDVWKFDLITRTWTQLLPDSNSPNYPLGRYLYEAALDVEKARYYFFSGNQVDNGVAITTLNDTWYYDINSNAYVQVFSLEHSTTFARIHGVGLFYNDHFIVVDGGDNPYVPGCPTVSLAGPQGPMNSIISLNVNRISGGWKNVDIRANTIGLKRITGVIYQKNFFYTAGFGFSCPSEASSTPIWNPSLYSIDLDQLTSY